MPKLIEIKATKCTLFLYENELMEVLPQELMIKALKRGKAIMRSRKQKEREANKFKGETR